MPRSHRRIPCFISIVLAIIYSAIPVSAATYYVATNGSDTTGNGSITSPWATPNKCVQSVSTTGGDTCIIRPGTYSGAISFTKSGTVTAKHTLRAEFPRISCVGADGHDCTVRTTNVTTLTSTGSTALSIGTNDNWIIEGFYVRRTLTCSGTDTNKADRIEVRYNDFELSAGDSDQALSALRATNWHVHHNMFSSFEVNNADVTDYGAQFYATDGLTIEYNVFRGRFYHMIALKRKVLNVAIRHNVFLGGYLDAIQLGQNHDDADSLGDLNGALLGGSTSTRNHTSENILAEYNFMTDLSGYPQRSPFRIGNTRNVVCRYNYIQLANQLAFHIEGVGSQSDIATGERLPHPEDVDIYGNTVVFMNSTTVGEPVRILARGYFDDRIRVFNNTFHGNPDHALRVEDCADTSYTCHTWFETATGSGTILEWYNNNVTSHAGTFDIAVTGLNIAQEGDNNWYQSGGTRGKVGDVSTSPLYIGPTTAPSAPTGLPATWSFWGAVSSYFGTTNLDRWRYQSGSPLIDAGRAVPTTDILGNAISFWSGTAPDIGSNEALVKPGGGGGGNCMTAPTTGTFVNSGFTNQTGTFTVEFDATPSASGMAGVVGISNGAAGAFTDLAAIVAFESSGRIDAINGASLYMADAVVNYTGGTSYHFRLVINVATHTYTVYVTPVGGSEVLLATNYAFRTEQAGVTQLNNVGSRISTGGTITTCNITVSTPTAPGAPSGLTASAFSFDQINLAWTDNANSETGFKIERKTGATGTYAQIATTGANVTSYSDTTCGSGTTYYYRVRATNAIGDSAYSNEANTTTSEVTGRQGHWKFDEGTGTAAADSSGNGNTGTLVNGPTWTTAKIGNGLNFDGTATTGDDVVNAGSGASLDDLPAITVAAWIKADSLGEGSNGRIVSKVVFPFSNGWHLIIGATNQIVFAVDYTTTDVFRRSGPNTLSVGAGLWQHVLVTWTGSATATNVKIYVNGTEVSSYDTTTNGSPTNGRISDAASNVFIGNSSDGSRTFDGVIDDVRVYNRVLTAAEITAIYRTGL